jgi:hypothetical protein
LEVMIYAFPKRILHCSAPIMRLVMLILRLVVESQE